MKIRSKSLPALLFAATCVATSCSLLWAAPARSANILNNPRYPGAPGANWNGWLINDPTNNLFGWQCFQNLTEPTILGQTYQISFDAIASAAPTLFRLSIGSNTVLDDNAIASAAPTLFTLSTGGNTMFDENLLVTPGTTSFTRFFVGDGLTSALFLDYRFASSGEWIVLDNINIDLATTAPTSVPEPFTILGTLIGGTAAIRLRNRLKASNKKVFSVDK